MEIFAMMYFYLICFNDHTVYIFTYYLLLNEHPAILLLQVLFIYNSSSTYFIRIYYDE